MMRYFLELFYPPDIESAKHVVLTPDPAHPRKFEEETAFLVSFIKERGLVARETRVLDFGCGMGRVAKALIEEFDCVVEGTDLSVAMQRFAEEYVASPRFHVRQSPKGMFDFALAVLVLQHVEHPEEEVETLYAALHPGGRLLVVNEWTRFVPGGTDEAGYAGWFDDGVNIGELLSRRFVHEGTYPYCGRTETPVSLWRKE